MSLINKMLLDLDKRGADAVADEPRYAQIRTVNLPPARQKWWWVFLPIALFGGILAWLIFVQFLPNWKTRQAAIPSTANHNALISLPSPKIVLASASQAEVPVVVPAVAADVTVTAPPLANLPLSLRLAAGLDKSRISATSATEKVVVPTVVAKVERISPEANDTNDKIKSAQVQSTVKPPEPVTVVSKFIKETTPQQRTESEYRQATVLKQQGRSAEAILMLEQTLKSDPQHTAARQTLISLLLEAKRHDDAMRWLQQWLSADRNQVGMAMILARLQVEKGMTPGATETLQRSLPFAQDKPDFLAFMAALQQRQAHHKEAADLYREALKRMPQNAVWLMGLAISLQADGRNQDALDAFRQAKDGSGLSPELLAFVEQKISQLQR